MTTFFAVADANGPISVAIDAETRREAREWFAAQTDSFVDDCRTDAEDTLGFCGDNMSYAEFASELESRGYSVADSNLDGSYNWVLWAKE